MKSFMAYLRTFLLCFGMLHLSMLPGYALAQENESNGNVSMPGVVEEAEGEVQNQQDQASNQNNQNSNQNKTVSHVATENAESGSGDMAGLIDLVTSMAIGVLGMAMITYQPPTTDMWIAIAAGTVYILGEIATLKATKEKMESKSFTLTHYADGSRDNMQVKALEKQKKSYHDLADMMETKSSIKMAAAAGFAAAAGMALVNGTKLATASAKCISSLTSEATTHAAMTPTPGPCAASGPLAVAEETGVVTFEQAPAVEGSTAKKLELDSLDKAQLATASAGCPVSAGVCSTKSMFRSMMTTMSPTLGTGMVGSGVSLIASLGLGHILEKLGLGPLKGLVTGVFVPLSTVHDKLLVSPNMRAISFGTLGVLIGYGATTSQEQAEKMRENAHKVHKMLMEMHKLEKSNTVDYENELAQTKIENQLEPSENFKDEVGQADTTCPTGGERGKSGECAKFSEKISAGLDEARESGFGGAPGAIVSTAGQLGNVADSLMNSGGLSDEAFNDLNELNSNSSALRDINRQLKDRVNRNLASIGKEPIDFDQKEKELADQSRKAVLKSLNDSGKSPEAIMASIGALGGFLPEDTEAAREDGADLNETRSASTQSGESETMKMPEAKPIDFELDDLDESGFEASASKNSKGETVVDVGKSLDTDGNDIVSNKDVSIFKVISVRYMKSGIPRLIDLE